MNVVEKLKAHGRQHTKKHMDEMRKLIRGGKTFTQAHNIVLKKFGK